MKSRIDTSNQPHLTVETVTRKIADRIVSVKHYRKTLGIFWEGFGLVAEGGLVGVVCYGQPSAPIQRHAFKDRDFRLYELNRLVVDAGVRNGASILISRSLKMLSSQPCAVVSYADTAFGHSGIVYQASNWVYTGCTKSHDNLYLVNGDLLHPTTVKDRFGVTDPMRWAQENEIQSVSPKPKHRYFHFVGNRRERKRMRSLLNYEEVESYPKSDHVRYDDTGVKCQSLVEDLWICNFGIWGPAPV